MARRLLAAGILGVLSLTTATAQAQTNRPATGGRWARVDTLRPGTEIVVTVTTGEIRQGRFEAAAAESITLDGVAIAKASITRVVRPDRLRDGAKWGALAGGGGMFALMGGRLAACAQGCEASGELEMAAGLFGTAIGTGVGVLVDALNGRDEMLYPPDATARRRVSVRLGPTAFRFSPQSYAGSTVARGGAVAVQVARFLTFHVEHTSVGTTFTAPPGFVPDSIVENVVPAAGRIAGLRRGIESTHIAWQFSELVGVALPAMGRVHLELLGGMTVQAKGERGYYDAYERTGAGTLTTYRRLPGKYSVLNFETPNMGWQFGIDGETAVVKGLVVVPSVRYSRLGRAGTTLAVGAGAQWRF